MTSQTPVLELRSRGIEVLLSRVCERVSGPENPPSPDSPPAPRRMSGLDPWDDPPTRDWEESSRPPLVFPADDGGAAARDPTSGPLV